MEWCGRWQQVILNTWFRQHPRHLYTWRSPGDRHRNQIDYVTINSRFRNAVRKARTFPGADCGGNCDHVPVVATVKLKLKKIKKARKRMKKNWRSLKNDERKRDEFEVELRNRYSILEEENGDGEPSIETDWRRLSDALTITAQNIIPNEQRRGRRRWMTEEILEKMEERRRFKTVNQEIYRQLDREIKRECKITKERWLNEKCLQAEELDGRDTREMYNIIREITGKKRAYRGEIIKSRDGNLLTDIDEVVERWREYVLELFDDNRGDAPELRGEMEGPRILEGEVRQAVKDMKNDKAEGGDGVVAEMVEAAGEFGIKKLTELANKIYDSGIIPEKMKENLFIAIPKKAGTVECKEHRTIALMSQMGKVILRVIGRRIKSRIMENIDERQYGFRKGKGTRNAIFILRMLIERAIEMQKDLYLCYIDFQKAFDTVKHEKMMEMLQDIG